MQEYLHRYLCFFQVTVHCRVHAHNRPLHNSSILQLNRHLFSVEFLQKFYELHCIPSLFRLNCAMKVNDERKVCLTAHWRVFVCVVARVAIAATYPYFYFWAGRRTNSLHAWCDLFVDCFEGSGFF